MIKISVLIGLGLFLWEHFGRISDVSFRPTIGINTIIDVLENIFTTIGSFFATISSYLCWIKFQDLWITITDLCTSLFKLITTPVYIIKGYIDTALEYVDSTYKIYIGSFLLIATIAYIMYRYRQSIPLIRSINIKIFSEHMVAVFCLSVIICTCTILRFNFETHILDISIGILCVIICGILVLSSATIYVK